jgi:hypothetical protein
LCSIFANSGVLKIKINKRDLDREREDRILVAEEKILHEIEASHDQVLEFRKFVKTEAFCIELGVLEHAVLKLALQMMAGLASILSNIFFTHNYSPFTLLFKTLLFSE